MTLPTTATTTSDESQSPEASCASFNPFFPSNISHFTSYQQQQQQQQQQQLLLTQLFLSGVTCPPLNPLANALQFLLSNSALLLQQQQQQQQQQSISHPITDKKKSRVSLSPVHAKHRYDAKSNAPIDCSSSDTNEKSTFDDDDNSPTIATTLAALPIHNNDTTIDGINLEEIKQFAKAFKLRRLALGLTQTQVGQALSVTRGPAYSQSAICRFEKLDITPKSATKIKPVLEKWMRDAELKYGDRLRNGPTHLHELTADLSSKKRKRRTSFTPQALEKLNDAFELNTHPSGLDMSTLAQQLNYDREVIRVWFCNKRQALKNSVKKFKPDQIHEENESTTNSFVEDKFIDRTTEDDEILS